MSTLSAIHGTVNALFSNLFVTLPLPRSSPELADKTFIVTGANQGLGYEACRHLLRIGLGRLIMGVRSLEKGETARAALLKEYQRPPAAIEVWLVDMERYDTVAAFAARARALARLDGVLANAGIMTFDFARAPGGDERTLAVNVVGTFLLFLLVLPKLRESVGRFVIPNSALHYVASTKEVLPDQPAALFDRLNDPAQADMKDRYNLSKLLVLFAVRAFHARLSASGQPPVIINTPNPSYCKSELIRDIRQAAPPDFVARTADMGSRTFVHALLAGPESSGQYLANCHVQA